MYNIKINTRKNRWNNLRKEWMNNKINHTCLLNKIKTKKYFKLWIKYTNYKMNPYHYH